LKRPVPKEEEYRLMKKKMKGVGEVAFKLTLNNKTIDRESYSREDVQVEAPTQEYQNIFQHLLNFQQGRYFSLTESHRGKPVVILGWEIAETLFPADSNRILKEVKLMGRKFTVIGVLEKKGEDLVSFGTDETVIIPYRAAIRSVNPRSESANPEIIVKGASYMPIEDLKLEVYGAMRSIRELPPKAERNFALNQVSLLSNQISQTFMIINIAGWIIGGFAMLVGGFGIANIMFVSVRERTNIIGIKKALGAKNYMILLEFLIESVILCLIGGVMGLLCVFITMIIANQVINLTFYLSMHNILLGLFVSVIVGILSGFLPALQASKMDPVSAIRFQ
jgi:putative ABC transport system permease protein